MTTTFFTDQFLIAMPTLADPNFFHSVTYICEHNADGAFGLVINRPLDLTLAEVASQMSLSSPPTALATLTAYAGGPVGAERGFVVHEPVGEWQGTLRVNNKIGVTTSRDIVEAICRGEGPNKFLVVIGYAGWEAGQLEQEMIDNAWLTTPARAEILFDTPVEKRWEAAASMFGIDLTRMSPDVGHG